MGAYSYGFDSVARQVQLALDGDPDGWIIGSKPYPRAVSGGGLASFVAQMDAETWRGLILRPVPVGAPQPVRGASIRWIDVAGEPQTQTIDLPHGVDRSAPPPT